MQSVQPAFMAGFFMKRSSRFRVRGSGFGVANLQVSDFSQTLLFRRCHFERSEKSYEDPSPSVRDDSVESCVRDDSVNLVMRCQAKVRHRKSIER